MPSAKKALTKSEFSFLLVVSTFGFSQGDCLKYLDIYSSGDFENLPENLIPLAKEIRAKEDAHGGANNGN